MSYREEPCSDLSELKDDEAVTFAALLRAMLRADGAVSEQERERLVGIAGEMGDERFWTLFDQAAEQLQGKGEVEAAARRVVRRSARELIFATLSDLAIAGTIVEAEAELLDWLAALWTLAPQPVDQPDED